MPVGAVRNMVLAGVLLVAGCGDNSNGPGSKGLGKQVPPGTPSRPIDLNGDGQMDAVQYDLNGDGQFDGVDVDGDGYIDGGDFDGDGKVTIFKDEGTGALAMTDQEMAQEVPALDLPNALDFDPELAGVQVQPAVDLSGVFPAAGNQGTQGSCAAWSVAATATYLRAWRENADPSSVWASPAYLYSKMVPASESKCGDGTFIHTGLDELIMRGSADLETVPYNDQTCAQAGSGGHPYRIGGYTTIKQFDRRTVQTYLSAGLPIVFQVSLPPNFGPWSGDDALQNFTSEAGQLDNIHGSAHAMVMVGYDDSRGAYRIQNSWGTDWGDRGLIWWSYDDFEKRDGLFAWVPTVVLDSAPAFPAPNAVAFGCTVDRAASMPSGGQTVVALRVSCNQPIKLARVTISGSPEIWSDLDQALYVGDVVLSTNAAVSGDRLVIVEGRLADGTNASASVPISL